MTASPTLFGYGPSVYCRVVRLVLAQRSMAFDWVEADPFERPGEVPHPMNRVPVLRHGGFTHWETGAITRYLDRLSGGGQTPDVPEAAARPDQVIGIVDAYAYNPMIRQVHSHGAFRPARGEVAEAAEVTAGLIAAGPVLDMLEEIAAEGLVLSGRRTLADCHLAPILSAFAQVPAATAALRSRGRLAAWHAALDDWPAFVEAAPEFATAEARR